MLVSVSDGEIIEPGKRCEECEDNPAAFACDYCLDNFCVKCFWQCHVNGQRRTHTATKINVIPQCNQCQTIRATVFCEQCQELMCTECFTHVHDKGNRMLHLFMDSMDLLVLLERLDPTFQEHMKRARPRVLWAISQLQGYVRGMKDREHRQKMKVVVTQIQRSWRGVLTRRKLLGMLHMHKWRRRQVNSYFLPKTSDERNAAKKKCTAVLAAKEVSHRAANAQLRELRSTIMDTAGVDPMENPKEVRETLGDDPPGGAMGSTAMLETGGSTGMAIAENPYTTYEGSSRYGGATTTLTGPVESQRARDMSQQNTQQIRDTTLRQITRLDDKPAQTR